MIRCHDCPCMYTVQRKYGITNHCWATANHLDVTYYCEEANKDKENPLCPLVNAALRFPEVDYGKYENIISHIRGNNDEST